MEGVGCGKGSGATGSNDLQAEPLDSGGQFIGIVDVDGLVNDGGAQPGWGW